MATSQKLNAYTLHFFDPHTEDSDLDDLFERAHRNRPAIVLLEHIDRAFPRTGESRSRLNLQQLLNCLNGVATA
jgi:SpoVK/Ycf46/Vps4 family AAA+-type ATPase